VRPYELVIAHFAQKKVEPQPDGDDLLDNVPLQVWR
jgi:hypothetical protein